MAFQWHKYCCQHMLAGKFTGEESVLVRPYLPPERPDPIRFAGKLMLKHFFLFVVALAGSLPLTGAFAATSIPMPEAGFALASNNGSSDTIAAPMPSDMGGGTTRVNHVAADVPSGDIVPATATTGDAIARDDHAGKGAPTDGSVPANSTATSHKSRGNAHWQSLLPGLMR
jgi:hypothetical protein